MRSDDELGRMLRSADPVKDLADPEDYAWMRDTITRAEPRQTAARARRTFTWPGGVLSLGAVAVLVALVFIVFMPTQHAALARTPRSLDFRHTGQTNSEVLRMAQTSLQESKHSAITTPERRTVSYGWYLHLDHDAQQTATGVISPEITTYDWNGDQSGQVRIVAGKSYWIDGSTDPLPHAAPKPGTVLSDMSFSAGSFGAPTADPPPAKAGEMNSWLIAMGLPEDATGADYMTTIQRAMTYWTLTNEQHAEMLQLLLHQANVRVLGTTTDRTGRPVVGVAADSTSSPGNRIITLISATTGRIVGMETIRTAPIEGLPMGSVTAYTTWENTE
jgi:hypothetical protein